jgi:hypothetical protein
VLDLSEDTLPAIRARVEGSLIVQTQEDSQEKAGSRIDHCTRAETVVYTRAGTVVYTTVSAPLDAQLCWAHMDLIKRIVSAMLLAVAGACPGAHR